MDPRSFETLDVLTRKPEVDQLSNRGRFMALPEIGNLRFFKGRVPGGMEPHGPFEVEKSGGPPWGNLQNGGESSSL